MRTAPRRALPPRGPPVVWAALAFAVLAVTEWLVWTRAETVPIDPRSMGTGLFGGVSAVLVAQLLVVLALGYGLRRWPLPAPRARHARQWWSGNELWLLLAVTGVGVVLRFAGLQEIPYGLWFDTAENGNQALRILHEPSYRPVFIAEATQLPALFVYFDALSINWLGPEALAVRVPAALFGAATVPAVWWLGRALGGPALGLTAAFALATSRWHLDFSRLAIASIVTPFALAVGLAATIEALRSARPRHRLVLSIVAGLAVSLGLWSYPAGVFMVPALGVGAAGWVLRGGRAGLRPRLSRGVLVLAVAAAAGVLSLLPLIGATIEHPETIVGRSETVAVSGANIGHDVFESAVQHVLMFTVRGDRNGRHNTPGRPELGWFAPLFLAGVGAALWRRGSGIGLALPATLFFLLGGILTLPFEAPQSHRSIMAVVPASLLIGLPVALAWSRQRMLATLLGGSLAIAGVAESADYFRAQLQDATVYQENALLETEAGRWLRALGPNIPVLAAERFRSHPSVRYLSGEHPSIAQAGAAVSEFLPLDGTQPAAVLASFDEPSLFDRARGLYTQAPIQTFGAPLGQGRPLLFTMFVSMAQQEQTSGFLAESQGGTLTSTTSFDASDAPAWSATMRVLQSGEYAVSGGGSAVAIDDVALVSAMQPARMVFLARGAHVIHVTRSDTGPPPRLQISLVTAAPTVRPPATPQQPSTGPLFFALPSPGGLLFTWQVEGRPQQAAVDSAPHREFEGSFNDGRPWTAQWRGKLSIARAGEYAFRLEAISSATLSLDELPVVRDRGEATVRLGPGSHAIRVEYVDREPYARLYLNWRPPGAADFGAIPDQLLLPALALP